jgi:uncharacterized membrane protein
MIEQIADIIDRAVVVLLLVGLAWVVANAVRHFAHQSWAGFSSESLRRSIREIRFNLGQILLLALEVLIISDILHSISHRTLDELALLAGTVAIRVVLAYFLDREVAHLDGDKPRQGAAADQSG